MKVTRRQMRVNQRAPGGLLSEGADRGVGLERRSRGSVVRSVT